MSRYKAIYKEIDDLHPRTIIEIGTYNGKQAKQMLEAASKFNPVKYYGFDLFEDITQEVRKQELHVKKDVPSVNQVKSRLSEYDIELIKGNTRDTLNEFNPEIEYPLLVWLDGGHSLGSVRSDFSNIKRLINKNTVVLLDDYYRSKNKYAYGCADLVEGLIELGGYNVEILPAIDKMSNGLEISVVRVTLRE